LSAVIGSIWKDFINALKYDPSFYLDLIDGPADYSSNQLSDFEQGGKGYGSDIVGFDEFEDYLGDFEGLLEKGDDHLYSRVNVDEGFIGLEGYDDIDGFDNLFKNFRDGSLFGKTTKHINLSDSTVVDLGATLLDLQVYLLMLVIALSVVIFSGSLIKYNMKKNKKDKRWSNNTTKHFLSDDSVTPDDKYAKVITFDSMPFLAGLDSNFFEELDSPLFEPPINPPAYEENLESSPLNLSFLSDDLNSSDLGLTTEEQQIISPFTLDSAFEVELSTFGGDTDLSISLKKNTIDEKRQNNESQKNDCKSEQDKIRIGLKPKKNFHKSSGHCDPKGIEKISRKPLGVLNTPEIEKPSISTSLMKDEIIVLEQISTNVTVAPIMTDIFFGLGEETQLEPKTARSVSSSSSDVETHLAQLERENQNLIRAFSDDGEEFDDIESIDAIELGHESVKESQLDEQRSGLTELPIIYAETQHILRSPLDCLETIPEEREYEDEKSLIPSQRSNMIVSEEQHEPSNKEDIVAFSHSPSRKVSEGPHSPKTPGRIPRKDSCLRVSFNDQKESKIERLGPSRIPILSPGSNNSHSPLLRDVKCSPIPESATGFMNVDRIMRFLECTNKNGEEFLTELFGQDPKLLIDEEFIDTLDDNDIDRIISIFKGKETSENWKARFDHLDILIGHLRSHLPEECYDYFQEQIFENLDEILQMISTNRSQLLGKVILFLRDIVYYGNILTDETFMKLLHALIPLTRTSQASKHISKLTFKSLCVMIQSINPTSFIEKFDSIFGKWLNEKKLKGEKHVCLFMIKFYIISNLDKFQVGNGNEAGELDAIIDKLNQYVSDLCIDGYQKTRSEVIEIYLLLLRIDAESEPLSEYYRNLSTFIKAKVPKPDYAACKDIT
jgi:hypothetical protein